MEERVENRVEGNSRLCYEWYFNAYIFQLGIFGIAIFAWKVCKIARYFLRTVEVGCHILLDFNSNSNCFVHVNGDSIFYPRESSCKRVFVYFVRTYDCFLLKRNTRVTIESESLQFRFRLVDEINFIST